MYLLQFDGMLQTLDEKCQKGGFLGYGWLITCNNTEIVHGFGLFAHKRIVNSNIAEYLALIEGLDSLLDLRIRDEPIEIRGDAKCIIDQMTGAASINSFSIQSLYHRARKLSDQFNHLQWGWVPRNKNKLADKLSRRGLRQLYSKPNAYEIALNRMNSHPESSDGFISLLDLRVYNPVNFGRDFTY